MDGSAALSGAQEPGRSAPDVDDDPQAALTRSVDKLQSELDETARRNAEMRKELQALRGPTEDTSSGPRADRCPGRRRLAGSLDEPARSVARFADVLKRHPARRVREGGNDSAAALHDGPRRRGDDPDRRRGRTGSQLVHTPKWSHDGTRIVFDYLAAAQFCKVSHQGDRDPRRAPGLYRSRSGQWPDLLTGRQTDRVLLNPGAEPGAEAGVWVMQADGSERRRVSDDYGAPFWSPDGREFLINGFRPSRQVHGDQPRDQGGGLPPGPRT